MFLRRLIPGPILRLIEGYWLVPMLLAATGAGLAVGVQMLETSVLPALTPLDPDGARAALSVVAGGVLTIASLVFSLTFVALSITTQQLSPRILDYVLQERATQLLLGVAFGTFIFAAATLASSEETRLVWSVYVALVLAGLTLFTVLIFSHRMTLVMRAEDMVSRLGNLYTAAIRRDLALRAPFVKDQAAATAELTEALAAADPVAAQSTGYLGAIDHGRLVAFAERNGLLIELTLSENAFVLDGQQVARVAGLHGTTDAVAREITAALNLIDRRTVGQTARYEADALAEAALRALSPGINDPATARSCTNRLVQGLCLIASSEPPPRAMAGDDGHPRVLRAPYGLPEIVETCLMPVAEEARDPVTKSHLRALGTEALARATRPAEIDALKAFIAATEPTS